MGGQFQQRHTQLDPELALDNNRLTFTSGAAPTGFRIPPLRSTQHFLPAAGPSPTAKPAAADYGAGPRTLSFSWQVSSESGCDFLTLWIDSTADPDPISGEVGWTQKTCSIPAGVHTITWVYNKD